MPAEQESGLEQKVNNEESRPFADKASNLGYNLIIAGAATAFGLATAGGLAPVVGAALSAGTGIGNILKGGKGIYDTAVESIRTYSVINAIIYPVIGFGKMTYPLIPNADVIGKAARTIYAMTAHNAVFDALYTTANHLISNYLNPKGLINSFKENYVKRFTRSSIGFAPGWALSANGIMDLTFKGVTAPVFALNALPIGFYNTVFPIGKSENTEQPSHVPAAQGALG